MEYLISRILNVIPFSESCSTVAGSDEFNNVRLTYTASADQVDIHIERTKPEFYSYLDSLSDELFEDACDLFVEKTHYVMRDFEDEINKGNQEMINEFK